MWQRGKSAVSGRQTWTSGRRRVFEFALAGSVRMPAAVSPTRHIGNALWPIVTLA